MPKVTQDYVDQTTLLTRAEALGDVSTDVIALSATVVTDISNLLSLSGNVLNGSLSASATGV